MTVKTGQVWAGTFVTLDAMGALSAGTPAGVLYVDGVANGATVTITGSNPYKFSVTLPSLTAGQRVDMYITATISTIATAAVVASEQADTVILSDGVVVNSGTVTTLTNAPAGMALEATLTAMKGAGWTTETMTAIDVLIDAIKAKTDLITTGTTLSIASVVSGSTMTVHRGDTMVASMTVGALTNYSKLWFTVKRDYVDADTASIIQIEKTAGLLYINGVAGTPANGSITIQNEATGAITITLTAAEVAKLSSGSYQWDVQILRSSGIPVSTLVYGEFILVDDVTKSIS